MKRLILCLLICTATVSFAQQKVNISSHASLTFPFPAEAQEAPTGKTWMGPIWETDNEGGLIMAAMIPYSKLGVDSAEIASGYGDPDFADAMIKGILGKLPGVAVLSREEIKQEGRQGYAIEMEKDIPDERFLYKRLSARILFSGEGMYVLVVYLKEGKAADKEKTAFFNSLRIN